MGFRQPSEMSSALEASVDRSSRRHGQFLVVVGALLGGLVGVVLGLAVEDPQTVAAAPGRPQGAVLAVTPPGSRPAASQATGSGDGAGGGEVIGRQGSRVADRPHQGHGNAPKAGKETREKHKESHGGANGAPDKGKSHTGKSKDT
jgi:hypothetical protein